MCGSVGLVVDGRVVLGVVVGPIVAAIVPVVTKLSWSSQHWSHHKRRSTNLVFHGTMVRLVMPMAVKM